MNKKTMILAISFLFAAGMTFARPGGGGFSGGGDRGGGGNGGGLNNGGNSDNGSTDNSDDNHSHARSDGGGRNFGSSTQPNNRSWGHVRQGTGFNYNRSNGLNNYRSHNRWNQPSQGFHHFNNYGNTQTNRGFGRNSGRSTSIPQNLRNMGINHVPQPLAARASLPNGFQRQTPGLPNRDPSGRPFSSQAISPRAMNNSAVRTQMAAIAGNRTFMAKVAATTPSLAMRNHYYWHAGYGYNYCTYYDRFGCSWYGWNCGAGFFWSQYYCGNWWWYDPWWGHWCWWSGGGWWWQDPATTTVYIYNNGSYAPTDSNVADNSNAQASNNDDYGGPVYGDDGQKPVEEGNAESNRAVEEKDATVDFLSQDGNVKVTVSATGDAFLYKMKNAKPSGKPVFLDSNVEEVKFSNSGTKNEKILLIYKDGSFTTYNADGTPEDGTRT